MKNKITIFIALIGILLPINVKALTGNVTLSCDKVKIKPGEETTCYIKANINEEVSAVDMQVGLGDNLTLASITKDPIWEGSIETEDIKLYGYNKVGNFNIASFKVKAGTKEGMDTKISLNSIKLTDGAEFKETEFSVTPVNIRVQSTVNTLTSLTVSGATFTFNENTTTYELNVDSDKTVISASKKDANSVLSGDTGTKQLAYGLNTFNVKVTSESGSTKTYTLKITRVDNRSKENYILGFKFNNYNIDFSKDKTKYDLIVDNKVTKIAVCYGDYSDDNILCIDEDSLDYSKKAFLDIYFNNKDASDILDEIEYECNDDESLCDITLNENKIGIEKTINNETQGYILLGDLKVGNNELKMVVTAENEEKREYIFNINRKTEEGKIVDKTDEEITSNIKTGSASIIIVAIVMVIALVVTMVVAKKKCLFDKIKSNEGVD